MTDVGSTKQEIKDLASRVAGLAGREPLVLLVALALVLVEVVSVPPLVAVVVPVLARWLVTPKRTANAKQVAAFEFGFDLAESNSPVSNGYNEGFAEGADYVRQGVLDLIPEKEADLRDQIENDF